MEDLIDIEGLDSISAWPLAFGWWFVIIASIITICTISFLLWRRFKYRRSWQYKIYTRLENLQHSELTPKDALQNLSVELRKIAIMVGGRNNCASLYGTNWLDWLERHDPKNFSWTTNGLPLINLQYMPEAAIGSDKVKELIMAAQGWVITC